jgi:hypothetical protein
MMRRNGKRRHWGFGGKWVVLVALSVCAFSAAASAQQIGSVTLLSGAPRMVGQSIRPLQPILSGSRLETGEADGVGMLVEDVVFHVGADSQVTLNEETGRVVVQMTSGFVVFYTDARTRRDIVVETPFGRLTARTAASGLASGWYAVRHDPEKPNVSPAVSTFSTIEGQSDAEGINPVAGPHILQTNQKWRIVAGQVPGPPEEGAERSAAEQLGGMLHQRTMELVHAGVGDVGLERLQPGVVPSPIVQPNDQSIYNANDAVQNRTPFERRVTPPRIQPPPEPRIAAPDVYPAERPVTSLGEFVSYEGTPVDPNWNNFLTSVDGNPAFQPEYIDQFANGGFSYIQIAGNNAQPATRNGEVFLVSQVTTGGGWALFTANQAIADRDFSRSNRALSEVVTAGFRAIGQADHLAGDGAIGGNGTDPGTAFALVSGGNVQLNPNPPAGYPMLDRASDTTGLTVGGVVPSDQIAALGAGRNPTDLSRTGPQLVFLSDSSTDALGNRFNFDGSPIRPTQLNLPADRPVQVDRSGAPSLARPLSQDANNTVGIQFAPTGDVIAIIHHTGLRSPDGASAGSEHFEVVRGEHYSQVQWRAGGRISGTGGTVIEAEDLNANATVRDELFALISEEVAGLTPVGGQTVAGPATVQPDTAARVLRSVPGGLPRVGQSVAHREVQAKRLLDQQSRVLKGSPGVLKSGDGRLLRPGGEDLSRRYIGRVGPAR